MISTINQQNAGLEAASAQSCQRPVEVALPELFPGDGAVAENGANTHDPTIIQLGNRYFCFSTCGDGFGELRSSKDLRNWQFHGPVMPQHPEWLANKYPHKSIWAPDILQMGARLRMYYCASKTFGGNDSVIGMAECLRLDPEAPQKGWKDHGPILESIQGRDSYNCIDPETLVDSTGRHWLYFGSYFSGIYVIELDPDTGRIKDPEASTPHLIARNTEDPENALEGAAITLRGGFYYLFISYGLAAQGVKSTYRIMVGRSKSPLGPFLDREGRSMVDGGHTNVMKGSSPMFSPGHCDVLRDDRGRWIMPYHFYDGRLHWHGEVWGRPQLQVRELVWAEDGWPLPGLPFQLESRPNAWDKNKDSLIGIWIHQSDFCGRSIIELTEDGQILNGPSPGTWSYEGRILTFKWEPASDLEGQLIDHLHIYYGGQYYSGRNNRGMVIRGSRNVAGDRA